MHYRVPENSPGGGPASQPDLNLRKRRAPWLRVIALWLLLAVLVYCLLELLGDGPNFGATVTAVTLGLAGVGMVAFVLMVRQIMRITRENEAAVLLLAAGRVDEALARFTELMARARRYPNVRATLMANAGVAWLRKGELERARAHFVSVLESGQLETAQYKLHRGLLLHSLALLHIARGEPALAAPFYRDAEAFMPEAYRGHLVLGAALLAARNEDYLSVVTITSARWSEAEGVGGAVQLRLLRLVRAFALAQLDAEAHATEVQSLVSGARPCNLGEYDYLLGQWPSLRAFFAAHGFARP